jgi:hypothetical protein
MNGPITPKIHLMHASGFDSARDELVAQYLGTKDLDVCLHDDPAHYGVLWNHHTITECMLKDTTDWSLVVQDDAVALPNWQSHLEQVQWYAPAPFVSLCHFSSYGEKLAARGVPFGVGKNTIWGQAVLYHHGVREPYAQLVRDIVEMDPVKFKKWDDGLIAVYNLLEGTNSSFTSRALFEHQDIKSTMGHVPGQWRHAKSTILSRLMGPGWGSVPRSRKSGPSIEPIQFAAAAQLNVWRLGRG